MFGFQKLDVYRCAVTFLGAVVGNEGAGAAAAFRGCAAQTAALRCLQSPGSSGFARASESLAKTGGRRDAGGGDDAPVNNIQIRSFQDSDEAQVIRLWERCGLLRPWNDPSKDIARKKRMQRELFLVGTIGDEIVASVMGGYDGHRGWVYYLAVDPNRRRQGLASALMTEVERRLRELGCAKINLQVRRDNLEAISFYERIGFKEDAVVSLGKRLERDD